jgi:hypothetical protein
MGLAIEVELPETHFGGLAEEIERLQSEDLDPAPCGSLGEQLVELCGLVNRLQAELCRRVGAFDKAQAYAEDGGLSTPSWLRWRCHLAPASAAEHLRNARLLPELPQTQAAFQAGEISFRHAANVARTAQEVGSEAVRDREEILVEAARRLDPVQFSLVTKRLRYCVDQDGGLKEATVAHDRRYLYLGSTMDGIWQLEGRLDPEAGEILNTALSSLLGAPVAGDGDERTPRQRRADALVELARQQLDSGRLPEVGGQKPQLTVIVEAAALRGEPGAPPAELGSGEPLPRESLQRLACDAALVALVVDEQGEPVSAGRASRTVPPALRRAVTKRDRGCCFPGCGRPSEWCDVHHFKAWVDGGEHSLANCGELCRRHHRMVHEEGWRLERGAAGVVMAYRPDGTLVPP